MVYDIIPVAWHRQSKPKADNMQTSTHRGCNRKVCGQGNNSSIGATVEKRGLSKI